MISPVFMLLLPRVPSKAIKEISRQFAPDLSPFLVLALEIAAHIFFVEDTSAEKRGHSPLT